MRFCDLLDKHRSIIKIVEDLEQSLAEIRGHSNWANGVENDQRHSVQMLWGSLKNHREKLRAFLVQEVTVKTPPPLPEGWTAR